MRRFFLVLLAIGRSIAMGTMITAIGMTRVVFVEFSRFLEFMAFAGNAEQADGHEKQ